MRNILSLFIGLLMLAAFTGSVYAGNPDPDDEYTVVKIKVGDVFKICKSGLVVCPVRTPICDDPELIDLVDTPDGLGYKAMAKGSTICSVQSNVGQRFIFRLVIE
jgi:hypothetical protein